VPGLALGPVLILVFSISLGWLPVSGANAGGGNSIDWRYWCCRRLRWAQSIGRYFNPHGGTAMLEELGQDYIRTARAKGTQRRPAVVCRHALPNALVPSINRGGFAVRRRCWPGRL